ncbi:hypothetical protein HQN89_35550 [Paenibacillus frigoriresistens]|uniref:hypothetical protein n=1 Tax=Paenibacillus alginolyticus TaxID=59839 RepID=UPI001563A6BE|nr:hypothetical protein [Paenibacillus frigoriresistens]NRF96114.1 hypothetical protein [Paenibacillus frigoriresistens]
MKMRPCIKCYNETRAGHIGKFHMRKDGICYECNGTQKISKQRFNEIVGSNHGWVVNLELQGISIKDLDRDV